MRKYYAIQAIGDYKVGDEVPEEKALLWSKMYVKSPVEFKDFPEAFPKGFDLNNDGKLDDKDSTIASKIMNKVKDIKKKSKR
jgi:hypothetical protein